jgi:hypothetical protein
MSTASESDHYFTRATANNLTRDNEPIVYALLAIAIAIRGNMEVTEKVNGTLERIASTLENHDIPPLEF